MLASTGAASFTGKITKYQNFLIQVLWIKYKSLYLRKILIYCIMNTNTTTTQANASAAGCRYYIDYVYNTEYGRKYWYFVFVRTSDNAILYANSNYNAVREYGRDMGINTRNIWDFSHNA